MKLYGKYAAFGAQSQDKWRRRVNKRKPLGTSRHNSHKTVWIETSINMAVYMKRTTLRLCYAYVAALVWIRAKSRPASCFYGNIKKLNVVMSVEVLHWLPSLPEIPPPWVCFVCHFCCSAFVKRCSWLFRFNTCGKMSWCSFVTAKNTSSCIALATMSLWIALNGKLFLSSSSKVQLNLARRIWAKRMQ